METIKNTFSNICFADLNVNGRDYVEELFYIAKFYSLGNLFNTEDLS